MKKINSITMRGVKGQNTKQELTGRDFIFGPNGIGKTTRSQALGIALMGYVPGGGKLPAETMKLASGDKIIVGLDTDSFAFERMFKRDGAKIETSISMYPPGGEKTLAEKEQRIAQELGKLPVMLDFNEFLSLSDMKRREFIYTLANSDEASGVSRDSVLSAFRGRLILSSETSDKQEIETLDQDIAELSEQYPQGTTVQAGLQYMLTYAKDQLSYWKKEHEKAVGASQKIAEYKNELAYTDRNLDVNTRRLEALQAELAQISGELVKAMEYNRRNDAANKKIAVLASEIADIESAIITSDADELRELIAQYSADIRNVDNSAAIAETTGQIETVTAKITLLEKDVERHRAEYNATKSKKDAAENLLNKILGHGGQCPIDCRIECDKDFSELADGLSTEIEGYDAELRCVTDRGKDAKAVLDMAWETVNVARIDVDRLRQEEVDALRENEQIRAIISEYEAEIAKIDNFDAEKAQRIAGKRGELQAIGPESGGDWGIMDTSDLTARKSELDKDEQNLKASIAEQTKARNTLANLKSSMVDGTTAGYHVENWKRIAEIVGPKGLQGDLVKDALAPLTDVIQDKFILLGIEKDFYFQTEDDNGKEVFQFGWQTRNGERRNFDALSTGEQMLLLIALMTTIIERINPPLKILCIDNIENLDAVNLRRVLYGLTIAGKELDNIILSGVMRVDPKDYPEWRVWDLGQSAESVEAAA